ISGSPLRRSSAVDRVADARQRNKQTRPRFALLGFAINRSGVGRVCLLEWVLGTRFSAERRQVIKRVGDWLARITEHEVINLAMSETRISDIVLVTGIIISTLNHHYIVITSPIVP